MIEVIEENQSFFKVGEQIEEFALGLGRKALGASGNLKDFDLFFELSESALVQGVAFEKIVLQN
jgi:hypothetical protein